MNKTKILTIALLVSVLLVLIVFGCSEKSNEINKDVVINTYNKPDLVVKNALTSAYNVSTNISTNTSNTNTNITNTNTSITNTNIKYFVCKDSNNKDYTLIFSDVYVNNNPVTAVIFKFKSQSKQRDVASDIWLNITVDETDIRKLSTITRINGFELPSISQFNDFYYDDEVEYYFTLDRFTLSSNSYKVINITHTNSIITLGFHDAHPIHNNKSVCVLVPGIDEQTAILKRNNII